MKFGYVKNKSKCSGCKEPFESGTLKVITPNIYGAGSTYKAGSYHFSCYTQENVTPPSIEDIDSVMKRWEIEEKDKEELENFVLECNKIYSSLYSKKRKFDTINVVTQDKGTKKTKEEVVLGLPFEIWNMILSYVSADLMIVYRLNFVNKDFYALAQQDSLWEMACKIHANKSWDLKEHLENTQKYLKIVIRNEGQEMEPNWKMIFIELYSKLCYHCHRLRREGNTYNGLGGKIICNDCSFESYKCFPKTTVKEKFKIPPKEMGNLLSEKEPTTRQGAKFKESYLALECQRYLEKKRMNSLKEKVTIKDIMKLELENPKRLYVETLIPDYSNEMKSLEKMKGYYGCKICKKQIFESSQRIESIVEGCLTFVSKTSRWSNTIECCKNRFFSYEDEILLSEIRKRKEKKEKVEKKQERKVYYHVGKWDLQFVPEN